jgi:hypothetical protein
VSSVISIKDAGLYYRKEEGTRIPFSFLVIVSGGEVREKNYFKIISDQNRFKQIKIEFVPDIGKGNPDRLLGVAKYKQKHYQTSQEDEPDKIFIVSDVDHFISELLRIKPECEKLGILLIISNSCFEVWLYYGKFNNRPTDFKIPDDVLKISQSFKTYLGTKIKGGIDPRKAILDIFENIQNAKVNYTEDQNGIPELFSTNMFLLAESLLPFIDTEIKKMIDRNAKKIARYKDILTLENQNPLPNEKTKDIKTFAEQLTQLTVKEVEEFAKILKSKYNI